jgi:hypothetical protein
MVAAPAATTLTPKEACMRFHATGGRCGFGSAWAWPGAEFFWMGPAVLAGEQPDFRNEQEATAHEVTRQLVGAHRVEADTYA